MKNILSSILFLITYIITAQVTTVPTLPTASEVITLTFDATNTPLKDYTGDIYAHTGVTIGGVRWQNVIGTWGVNTSQPKLTRTGTNTYTLIITPSIYTFYNVPTSSVITELNLVFRSSAVNGQPQTADIFIPIYPAGLNVSFTNPLQNSVFDLGQSVNITAEASVNANLELFINGVSQQIATNTKTINKNYTFTTTGTHTLKVTANNGTTTKEQIISVYVKSPTQIAAKPANLKYGINKNPDNSVTFLLKAPFKNDVLLIGDFNNWTLNATYQLFKDGEDFWITVPSLNINTEYAYQYFVDYTIKIADPYSEKILDSWTDQYIKAGNYPNLKAYPTNLTTGYVSTFKINEENYNWTVTNFTKPNQHNLVIYELYFRDFTESDSFTEAITKLDYLVSLGINAIELMPINEFEGADSWGYNPALYMALDKSYGTKNDFKKFVDECHKRGIAVLADVVFNHSYGQSPLLHLYWDSSANKPALNSPYYNRNHNFVDNGSAQWGYDFNHESTYTKNFFKDVLTYWMTEYKIDGFRFDFTKGFSNTEYYGTSNWGSAYDAARISNLKNYADHVWNHNPTNKPYVIFEHLSDNPEEKELADYGIMLWGNMNYSYSQNSMGYSTGTDISWISHKARNWNQPNVVGYMESHDEERMMYRNINSGNATQSPTYNVKELKTALARQELAGMFFLTIPGPKMIWQFGELGYDFSINRCTDGSINNDCRLSRKPIKWDYFNDNNRKHVYSTWATLNAFRKIHPAFQTNDFTLNVSTLLKSIQLKHTSMDVVIVGNFDVTTKAINPQFTKTGTWYEYFTGEIRTVSNTTATIDLKPGEYRLYSTVKIADPFGTASEDNDGDGVSNSLDQCPNTLIGTQVNTNGCSIFSLPATNFKLETTQPTCQGKNNGILKITATESHNYVATVNGTEYPFTTTLNISNLAPKTYPICIKIPAQNNYTQCFEFTITNPPGLVGRTAFESLGNKTVANITIETGTAPFVVEVNGKSVLETSENSMNVAIKNGDLIKVKSSISCEGTYNETINFLKDITVYPNPTTDFITVFLPDYVLQREVPIQLLNYTGKVVYNQTIDVINQQIRVPLNQLPTGLYILRVQLDSSLTFKVIKK
ncbi:MAG: alpha-amylase family glycosyl hydrolase [Flavobacteriaceae bacterium]|nr:alpha-amylase family glycosyl hydrolase [Flavobacteriaceae bacterium]